MLITLSTANLTPTPVINRNHLKTGNPSPWMIMLYVNNPLTITIYNEFQNKVQVSHTIYQ